VTSNIYRIIQQYNYCANDYLRLRILTFLVVNCKWFSMKVTALGGGGGGQGISGCLSKHSGLGRPWMEAEHSSETSIFLYQTARVMLCLNHL
jgi:hypothetical protein